MGVADDKTISAGSVAANAEEDLAPGTQVGEYVVETKLGEGGFGAVFRATHPLIGKTAAVKVLNREFSANHEMVSRFIAEARAVNQIRHRNIIDIFAFGALPDGRQYYIMELLEGRPLDQHIAQVGRMDLASALPIFRGIARALDAAHKSGIVHRDLKPENVYLVPNDEGGFAAKLLDFGIAKLLPNSKAGESGHHKTRTGTQMGTPYYMSPEQCRGIGVDHRTDIYALGVMVQRVLSGVMPFDGESVMDVMMKHITVPPPKLSSYGFPIALDEPVGRMMAKEPGERPASCSEAIDALAKVSSVIGYDSASLPPITQPAAHASTGIGTTDLGMSAAHAPPKRSAAPLIFAAVALVGLGAGGLVLMRRENPPPTPPPVVAVHVPPPVPTPAPAPMPKEVQAVPTVAAETSAKVKFDTVPKAAEVWVGDLKLGTAPGPYELPVTGVDITLKAAGFAPKTMRVTPKEGETVKATLTPAAGVGKPKPSGTINKDLEDPFGNK